MRRITLTRTRFELGTAAVIALVALRLGVGWHFFKEGAKKFHDPNFTSAYFLEQATGPLAGLFRDFIPDRFGYQRLSLKTTKDAWKDYRERLARRYRFDDSQQKQASDVQAVWEKKLNWWFANNKEDLDEYFLEVQRLRDALADKDTFGVPTDVPFRREWAANKENELRGKMNGWVGQLKRVNAEYQEALLAVATPEQRNRGDLEIPDPAASWVDVVVKYFIIAVGVCLILGLFTRTASIGGAGFLVAVLATQPPWAPGAQTMYFYYQLVELLALLLLAATGAGRFAGLDFFIYSLRMRCCPPKTGDE